jgi:hypothetical protein
MGPGCVKTHQGQGRSELFSRLLCAGSTCQYDWFPWGRNRDGNSTQRRPPENFPQFGFVRYCRDGLNEWVQGFEFEHEYGKQHGELSRYCRRQSRKLSRHHRNSISTNNFGLLGLPVNWLLTGVGRAYLAYCPARERQRIVETLRLSTKAEDRLAREPARLNAILAEVRARGYATRDPIHVGGWYGRPPHADGLISIAVPLRDGPRVLGSVNIVWLKTAFSVLQIS